MGKDNLFMNDDGTQVPYELNCSSEQLRSCFFNPSWDNSMDQNDPFESALSSMVSSPATSNAGVPPRGARGENIALRELIGRLGSICNSGEISPQSCYIGGGNNSNNTSCYSTPINSPPKLNLDHQIRGNLPFLGNNLPAHPSLAPFPTDPGFAERAARFSCFANKSLSALNGQFGLVDGELPHKLVPKLDSGKLSRVSSNQSLKNSAGSQMMEVQDPCSDNKKISKLSRPSTPENIELGFDSRENSSVSEQITANSQNDGNSRKRKAVPRGKAKEPCSSNSAKDANIASDNNNNGSSVKRSKSAGEDNVNEKDATKGKSEQNGGAGGDGKSSKDNNAKLPEAPKDYIHVRARRGQATDAHSLAERVRREKISERMKLLQDLVPGCNKVTGKAVMLDEIINYVQSLQRQVEFLSMKLAAINPRMDFNVESLLSKDVIQSRGALPHNIYHNHHPSVGSTAGTNGGFPYPFPSQTGPMSSTIATVNHMNAAAAAAVGVGRNPHIQLPPLHNFGESASQVSTFWEDDLQTVVQMGFGQNQSENIHGQ